MGQKQKKKTPNAPRSQIEKVGKPSLFKQKDPKSKKGDDTKGFQKPNIKQLNFLKTSKQKLQDGPGFGQQNDKDGPQAPVMKDKKSLIGFDVKQIGCREKRLQILYQRKSQENQLKKKLQTERREESKLTGQPLEQPLTIEDKREVDDNFIFEDEDEELKNEEQFDEFAEFFESDKPPQIYLTTNQRPKGELFDFLQEIVTVFPKCFYWPRDNKTLKETIQDAEEKQYTDIMVFRENQRKVDELILIHLPKGPTAIFKVMNPKLNQQLFNHGRPTDHNPELILNNFNTKVGRRIGRFFASLFPQNPEFKGRRVATFHNHRDYIFFRHHRYIYEDEGTQVRLQEIGPRFTLKLQKLQMGVFDNVFGEIEFQARDDMYVSRKRTFI